MLELFKAALAWLTAIDPALPHALLVGLVFLTVYVIRKVFPRAWELFAKAVPVPSIDPAPLLLLLSKTWQALPGAVIGAALVALNSGGDVRAATKGAVYGALAALAHEVLKAVPWVPYRGALGKTSKVPTLPVLCLFLPAVLVSVNPYLTGCAAPPSKTAVSEVVQRSSALAFNGATLALLYLDEQEAKHLDALDRPTALQLEQATLRVERLAHARDALVMVRQVLAGELGDLDERGKLREAVKALDLVAAELELDGVNLPADLKSALAAARVVL